MIHFSRIFHYKVYPFWGITIFGNTHVCPYKLIVEVDVFSRSNRGSCSGFELFCCRNYLNVKLSMSFFRW